MDFLKWLTDWIGRWQVWQSLYPLLKPALLPVGTGVLTLGAGFFQHMPWMWVFMATALSCMGVIVTMFYVASYSNMRTPLHKLRYVSTVVAQDLGSPPNRKAGRAANAAKPVTVVQQAYLAKVQIGVQLQNAANFPISALIAFAETNMSDLEPPRTTYPKEAVTITPGNVINMLDMPIEMHSALCGNLQGYMNISIKYGRRGKETFEMSFKAKLEVFMRRDGMIQFISTVWDSNRLDAKGPPN